VVEPPHRLDIHESMMAGWWNHLAPSQKPTTNRQRGEETSPPCQTKHDAARDLPAASKAKERGKEFPLPVDSKTT